MDITLVDVGGMPQTEKMPVIEQCTHLIIISRDPKRVKDWQNLCPQLHPVMVIESVQESRFDVVAEKPFLQVIAGPWERGETMKVPGMVLERVLELLPAVCED